MITSEAAKRVLEILDHESSSLKTLAYISGYDPFVFYQSADLTGLDLEGQDLSGLNFDLADFRGSNVVDVHYDQGAFNNAILPENTSVVKDEFDLHLSDLLDDDVKRLYMFIHIREGFLDVVKSALRLTYQDLADLCQLSSSTLRKARRGEAIMLESAQAIARAISTERDDAKVAPSESILRQPAVGALSIKYSGGFDAIPRASFFRYLTIAKRIYLLRKNRESITHLEGWRDGPSLLEWYHKTYFQADEEIGSLYLKEDDASADDEGSRLLL